MKRKEQAILIAIGANFILILLRFILAGISGSLGIRANAWHSLADIFVSGVVYLGLVIVRLGNWRFSRIITRLERVVALFVSLFVFYMGIELFLEAIKGEGVELRYLPVAAIGAFLGVIICYFMARYKIYVGRETNSPSLIADGYHSKMDMYCSIAVLVGLVGALFGIANLDKIAATVVVVFIFTAAYEIFASNIKALLSRKTLGESPGHLHPSSIKKPKTAFIMVVIFLFIAIYLFSGIYYVSWDERGIVRRFGKVIRKEVPAGLHYRSPYPFERVDLIKVGRINRIETGSNLLLSGDTNLINVNIAVHYKISDAVQYLLKVKEPTRLIADIASSSIRQIVGEKGIDLILTTGKSEIEAATGQLLQKALDSNNAGIEVVNVQLLDMAPPKDVIEAFQDVASAREDKVTYINEARAYYNALVPEARGKAFKNLREAEAYQEEKINMARGDSSRFLQKLEEYEKSKNVTEVRLYLETMEKILPRVEKILLGENVETESTDLWLIDENVTIPKQNVTIPKHKSRR